MIQRKNPLPRGRYAIDIIPTQSYPGVDLQFREWLRTNQYSVHVLDSKIVDSNTGITAYDPSTSSPGMTYSPKREWYLFDVDSPVDWPRTSGFGLPTIVQSPQNPTAPVITKPEDMSTRGPKPTVTDTLPDWHFPDVSTPLGLAGLLALAYFVLK